jgi:hypothetical protein
MKKAKERYRLEDGSVCPGVTTITGQLGWNKQMLINWANKLGLKGLDANKYRDDKADIGTLAHSMILANLNNEKCDISEYTPKQTSLAENCLLSYNEWAKGRKIEPLVVEKMLISEELRFGGTPDFWGRVDGLYTLVDYKTGKGIYPEYIIQVSAYNHLLKEKGNESHKVMILNIPRSEDESFQERIITEKQLSVGWQIFKHLLSIYWLKNVITKED